jgi:hypothetical protein
MYCSHLKENVHLSLGLVLGILLVLGKKYVGDLQEWPGESLALCIAHVDLLETKT